MNPVKYHLILNPRSNSGKAAKKFETIFRLMTNSGLAFNFSFAETYQDIRDASSAASNGECDVVVAVGGDGTINAAINGMYGNDGMFPEGKMFGVIYTGTSPDFCRSYGVPQKLQEAIEVLRQRKTRKIRIGSIDLFTDPDQERKERRYFSCCASIGVGAMVAEKANRYRKYAGDLPGTLGAIFSSLASYHPKEITLEISGKTMHFERVTNLFIGRTKYIASGLKAPQAIPDEDNRFYILCVNNLTMRRLPGLLKMLYSGDFRNSAVMNIQYSDSVSVNALNQPARIEFDGDAAGYTPCNIRPASSFLSLIVG